MASRLRIPALALSALSFGLNIAIIGCAARPLHIFETQRHTNPFFLPIWNGHFDNRQLSALMGSSAVVAVMNVVIVVSLFVAALPANALVLGSSAISSLVALIAIIFASVLNHQAPVTDTLLTWTCRWRAIPNAGVQGVPRDFDAMCHETRFAYYTTIPSFVLQLMLLGLALYAIHSAPHPYGVKLAGEKGHELDRVSLHPGTSKEAGMRVSPISVRAGTKS